MHNNFKQTKSKRTGQSPPLYVDSKIIKRRMILLGIIKGDWMKLIIKGDWMIVKGHWMILIVKGDWGTTRSFHQCEF